MYYNIAMTIPFNIDEVRRDRFVKDQYIDWDGVLNTKRVSVNYDMELCSGITLSVLLNDIFDLDEYDGLEDEILELFNKEIIAILYARGIFAVVHAGVLCIPFRSSVEIKNIDEFKYQLIRFWYEIIQDLPRFNGYGECLFDADAKGFTLMLDAIATEEVKPSDYDTIDDYEIHNRAENTNYFLPEYILSLPLKIRSNESHSQYISRKIIKKQQFTNKPIQTAMKFRNSNFNLDIENYKPVETLSLDDYRDVLKKEIDNTDYKPGVYFIDAAPGTGKTYSLIQSILEHDKRLLYVGYSRAQIKEALETLKTIALKLGKTINPDRYLCLTGATDKSVCIHTTEDELQDFMDNNNYQSIKNGFCIAKKCTKLDDKICEYHNQFDRLDNHHPQYLFITRQRLSYDFLKTYAEFYDVTVLDEDFTSDLIVTKTFTKLSNLKKSLEKSLASDRTACDALLAIIESLRVFEAKLKYNSCAIYQGFPLSNIDIVGVEENFCKDQRIIEKKLNESDTNYFDLLKQIIIGNKIFVRRDEDGEFSYTINKRLEYPKNKPIFILDATGNIDIYQSVFSELEITQLMQSYEVEMPKYSTFIQTIDGNYSKSTVVGYKNDRKSVDKATILQSKFINLLKFASKDNSNIAVITLLNLSEKLEPELPLLTHGHYGDIKGLNKFETIAQLFCIGNMYLKDTVYQQMYFKFFNEIIDIKKCRPRPDDYCALNYRDQRTGIGCVVKIPTFDGDMRLQAINEFKAKAELIQAIFRIRPLNSDANHPKTVYIITNELISNVVPTELTTLNDLLAKFGVRTKSEQKLIDAVFKLNPIKSEFTRDDIQINYDGEINGYNLSLMAQENYEKAIPKQNIVFIGQTNNISKVIFVSSSGKESIYGNSIRPLTDKQKEVINNLMSTNPTEITDINQKKNIIQAVALNLGHPQIEKRTLANNIDDYISKKYAIFKQVSGSKGKSVRYRLI
ncbi:MAG TPA: hypothetical protein DCS13_02770 [Candidatus Margulisbacteria bacterium]|nr:hypothetical protein [Candidatus Margulisiibacteriota bacterium]